ncbi:hypothetical protein ColTof4_10121 [Colletotrichum tofieldiae]|nr:hypothetical protein ColTof3_06217 [Colletotrichum tofieldiae]GKT77698.1 hypothetical protein ColTof4_10121 [Colletotrichum tofieldiae]GKT85011.1 hypothetical protein Ct61P_02861 [Colletotrichum tofieldiae]
MATEAAKQRCHRLREQMDVFGIKEMSEWAGAIGRVSGADPGPGGTSNVRPRAETGRREVPAKVDLKSVFVRYPKRGVTWKLALASFQACPPPAIGIDIQDNHDHNLLSLRG